MRSQYPSALISLGFSAMPSFSKRGPGRPPIPTELQALIRRFASENGWRARKVEAELVKLGFSVSLATVSRYRIPGEIRATERAALAEHNRLVNRASPRVDYLS